MKMPNPRGSERYQRIAPRHHIKGAILDAVGVALMFVFTGLMGCIVLMLSVPR